MEEKVILRTVVYRMMCPHNHTSYLYKTRLVPDAVKTYCVHCGEAMAKKITKEIR